MDSLIKHKNIIAVFLISIIFVFIARQIHSSFIQKYRKLDKEKKEFEEKKVLANTLSNIEEEFNNLKKRVFKGDIFDFKKVIENNAAKRKIIVDSLIPKELENRKEYKKVRFILELKTDYDSLRKFVSNLESTGCVDIRYLERRGFHKYLLEVVVILKE